MLDGYAAAIVSGPVSMSAPDWICPLLAIDADAFNHGGTPEFAAISAVALRHNDISNVLSTAPHRFAPVHGRKPNGDVDARPWCQGFYAATRLRLSVWAPLLDISNIHHGLLLPILRPRHCRELCSVRTVLYRTVANTLSIGLVTGMRFLGANVLLRCSTSWRMVRPSGQRHREHEVRAGRCTR